MVLSDEEIKQKRREYYQKNKEKIKKNNAEYRLKNKEKLKKYSAEYEKKNREKNKEKRYINSKKQNKTFEGKKHQWKSIGLKHTDEELRLIYDKFNTIQNCESCNCSFNKEDGKIKKNTKCCDHHHPSGSFRNFICVKCNIYRKRIDRQLNELHLELNRYYFLHLIDKK
jgi:hypothetical protein